MQGDVLMEVNIDKMVSQSELINLGFKPNQANQMIRECKAYLVEVEGIIFYSNRQVRVVPSRIIEKIFHIKVF